MKRPVFIVIVVFLLIVLCGILVFSGYRAVPSVQGIVPVKGIPFLGQDSSVVPSDTPVTPDVVSGSATEIAADESATEDSASATDVPTPPPSATAGPTTASDSATPASGPDYQPLEPALCVGLADSMSTALTVDVQKTADVPFQDHISGDTGVACRAEATGNGLDFKAPSSVMASLADVLEAQGWQQDVQYQADGPTGTAAGFRKDAALCLASVEWTPSADADCDPDQPIASCELSPEQQLYTIKLDCAQVTESEGGADATNTPTPADGGDTGVLQSGSVPLLSDPALPDNADAFLDLDTGAKGDKIEGDIEFVAKGSPATSYVLRPVNGASAALVEEDSPDFAECQKQMSAFSPNSYQDIVAGDTLCVLTNGGHLARLVVEELDQLGPGSIQTSFVTWMATPVPPAVSTQPESVLEEGTAGEMQEAATRINFEPGSDHALARDMVEAGQTRSYLVKGNAGQTMTVELSSPSDDTILVIWGEDGTVLISDHAGATSWNGPLPISEDYFIKVVSVGDDARYTLDVTVSSATDVAPALTGTPTVTPSGALTTTATVTGPGVLIEPLSPSTCGAMMAMVINSTGLSEATLGDAPFSDFVNDRTGTGCQVTATGSGLEFGDVNALMANVANSLEDEGWTEDSGYRADGPMGTNIGFGKDSGLCLLSVSWLPAPGADCGDQPIGACQLEPEQKLYTLVLNCAQASGESAEGSEVTADSQAVPKAISQTQSTMLSGWVTLSVDADYPEMGEAYLDLDTGRTGEAADADLQFVTGEDSAHPYVLVPVNGALAALAAESEPGLAGCEAVQDSFSEDSIPEIEAGSYICVLTGEGRLAQVHIEEIDQLGKSSIKLNFVTQGQSN